MAGIAPQQQHIVSPLEEPRQQTRGLSSHKLLVPPVIQGGSQVNSAQLAHSTSESTLVSKSWQLPPTESEKRSAHRWTWEWLCELLALGSLGALVVVLMHYQNKPQADWQQSYFTLNGLVAFLATLIKTGLIIPVSAAIGQRKWLRYLPNRQGRSPARQLGDFETFDEASRGSLGSVKLMFSLNAWDIVCLGAFITVVSVFFSAITQNVLGTYDTVRDGRMFDLYAGEVPRSELFNRTNQPHSTSVNFNQHLWTDVGTLAAVYQGIMSDAVPDVPISCATGNCTWPTIPTLGICGACIDMQRQLQVGDCAGMLSSQPTGTCNYSIPGGMTLTKPRELMEWNDTTPVFIAGPGSNYIFNRTDVVGDGDIYGGISFNFIGQTFSEFSHANRGDFSPGNNTAFYRANVLAYECGLWTCLQARSVNASNGIVQDTLIDFRNGNSSTDKNDKPFIYDETFNIKNISDYNVWDFAPYLAMQSTLVGALSGSITINANWDVDYTWAQIPMAYRGGLRGGMGSAADCLHSAWVYADDIERWWARLAKSLTNNIRMNGFLQDQDRTRYAGIAWSEVVHIEVRWLWLIFPAVLVLLSAIFLVATMIASYRSGLKPWKSFILPVLFTRLEEGLQEEWKQEYASESSLLSEVKHRWAGLDNSGDTWVFRHVDKNPQNVRDLGIAGDTSVDG